MKYKPLTRGQLQIVTAALSESLNSRRKYDPLAEKLGITRKELMHHLKFHGLYRGDVSSEDEIQIDDTPTSARPGSLEKIDVLKDRAARRVSLWHPEDETVIARIGKTWQANIGTRHNPDQ